VLTAGRRFFQRNGIEEQELRLEGIDFRPGRYSILIQGSENVPAMFSLESRIDTPTMPKEFSAETSHLATVARALWLAQADGSVWRLDGIEQLVPLVHQGDPLATHEFQQLLWTPLIQ
jgi:hypothetical protein